MPRREGSGKGNIYEGRQDKYKQRKTEMEHRKKNPEIKMCSAELQEQLHYPSSLGQPILE